MVQQVGLISLHNFKTILRELHSNRPDICIRYRILGEMWNTNFVTIMHLTESGALFQDDRTKRFISVNDLSSIMQFEIDKSFMGFQPYYHYEVHPLLNFSQLPL